MGDPKTVRRRPIRKWYRRRIRPLFSQPLSRLAALVVPHLYVAYMRFVWATSRIEGGDFGQRLNGIAAEYDGAVALLWHEEVFTVAYGYDYLGLRGHTLASIGRSGEMIARMLKLCHFVVFRGGTSSRESRRREGVLADMIEHMRNHDQVIYGLTVDGSKGPRYRMKTGGIIIARDCGKPVALVRTWYKRHIRLNTWDRMAIPLPFNLIRYYLRGPIFVPDGTSTLEGLERFRQEMEDELIDLARQSYADMGEPSPNALRKSSEEEGRE